MLEENKKHEFWGVEGTHGYYIRDVWHGGAKSIKDGWHA